MKADSRSTLARPSSEASRVGLPTYSDVVAASARLSGAVASTPVATSEAVDSLTGATVYMKSEVAEKSGSFKFRGAMNALAHLPSACEHVCTVSSGNHAQALARAARDRGIRASVLMPNDSPTIKREATLGYGAEVVLYDRYSVPQHEAGAAFASETGATYISPYDNADVIAGAGTAALELIRQVGMLDVLIVPVGGGGLLSGSALAMSGICPSGIVYGAEPARSRVWSSSLRAGRRLTVDVPRTIADGQQLTTPGELTFSVIKSFGIEMLSVDDSDMLEAMKLLFERCKLVAEPSGAIALAALLSSGSAFANKRVGLILSGGNIGVDRIAAPFAGKDQ